MDAKRMKLAAKMLRDAAEHFSNHGCNDLPASTFDGWTDGEKELLAADMRQWNGGNDPWPEKPEDVGDDGLMDFLADELDSD